jgi:hypothetical protein|tara:strand:- start:268 stop:576 length:309 start_codon:yes stop_codon:yes gene_type:complete
MAEAKVGRRPYQDYGAWANHGTQALWADISATPLLALEIVAQHVNALGCVNASETSSAVIAAGICVLKMGNAALTISAQEADSHYQETKAIASCACVHLHDT